MTNVIQRSQVLCFSKKQSLLFNIKKNLKDVKPE